jgi:hypothetical protein
MRIVIPSLPSESFVDVDAASPRIARSSRASTSSNARVNPRLAKSSIFVSNVRASNLCCDISFPDGEDDEDSSSSFSIARVLVVVLVVSFTLCRPSVDVFITRASPSHPTPRIVVANVDTRRRRPNLDRSPRVVVDAAAVILTVVAIPTVVVRARTVQE